MYVTKSAVSLLKCTYPVIHHSLRCLPRIRSVLRASLCIPSRTACGAGVKKESGEGEFGLAPLRAPLLTRTPKMKQFLLPLSLLTSATQATFIVLPLTQSNLLCCQKRSKTNLASLSLRWIHLISFF